MSRIIELSIDNEWVRGDRVFAGATGSHDDVILRMAFGEMWDGLTKTVEFFNAYHENPVIIVLTTNLLVDGETEVYDVPIPAEAKVYPGNIAVTIKGVKVVNGIETKATLSVYGEFEIKDSLWNTTAEIVADITPTVAAQLQAEVDSIKANISIAASSAAQAAESASSAADSAATAESAAETATHYGQIAEQIQGMTVSAESKAYSEAASVTKTESQGVYNLHFGIPRGTPGVSVQAGSYFGFYVDTNAHLHVVYADGSDDNPEFEIDENGHLIMTLE